LTPLFHVAVLSSATVKVSPPESSWEFCPSSALWVSREALTVAAGVAVSV
jgi:hypothetical protein